MKTLIVRVITWILLFLLSPVTAQVSIPVQSFCLPLLLDGFLWFFLFLFLLRIFLRFFFLWSFSFFCLFLAVCFILKDWLVGLTVIVLSVPSAGFPCIHRGCLSPALLIFVYFSLSFTNFRSMEKSSSSCLLLDSCTSSWTRTMLSFVPFQLGP